MVLIKASGKASCCRTGKIRRREDQMLLHCVNAVTEMTICFSTGETRRKGRPVASALGKRWQGWPAASTLGKHGDMDGQWFQHWKNVLVENARRFSTEETRW
jgi:hypothetical protein